MVGLIEKIRHTNRPISIDIQRVVTGQVEQIIICQAIEVLLNANGSEERHTEKNWTHFTSI